MVILIVQMLLHCVVRGVDVEVLFVETDNLGLLLLVLFCLLDHHRSLLVMKHLELSTLDTQAFDLILVLFDQI